ncbi:MAG: tryptophan synthase subunit alpha [Planctomycetota bacterium]|nr:tryptophan synthase subunit alpha [Planctomycetota bacterium]
MNRIDSIFADLRRRGAKALMPYLTVGDPDLATTRQLLPAIEKAGAAVCELGLPFSDPIADGPVIQASMNYALERGLRVRQILDAVSQDRPKLKMGLVAMGSYTLVHKVGPAQFVRDAKAAGIDGLIIPDLPLEESSALRDLAGAQGLIFSMLIAPTTPIERAEKIAKASSGFVYLLSRGGITGERTALPPDLGQRVQRLRQVTDLPITVGFGVSTAEQVGQVVGVADAAIVGSAIMRRVAEFREKGSPALVAEVGRFVGELASGLTGVPGVKV